MAVNQLTNPSGVNGTPATYSQVVEQYIASGTILTGQTVELVVTTLNGALTVTAIPATNAALAIGVALDGAISGQPVDVITQGVATAISSTAVTAGEVLSCGTVAGELNATSAIIGSNVAVALAAFGAGTSGLVYVQKM